VTGDGNGEEGLSDPVPSGVDPNGTGASERHESDAAGALAREVYWAGDGVSRLAGDVGSLRERLDAFTHQMRVEQRQLVPAGETLFGSTAGWKQRTKLFVWRLTRFSTMRYDRLLADLAEMNGELAGRLLETEEELARMREDLDRRGGTRS
jgi:hypothetical protein